MSTSPNSGPIPNGNDFIATSWESVIKLLYNSSPGTTSDRYRSSYVFRGCTDKNYDLSTSLMRIGSNNAKLERSLLRGFKKYTGLEKSEWEILALAQHHGLPTRLLDWSYSPFVALHFATVAPDKGNADGVIWCVNYAETNKLIHAGLKDILRPMEAEAFTIEMLSKAADTLEEYDDKFKTPEGFVIIFEPPSLDERIVNQYALFSMTSSATLGLDALLANHPELFHRVIIPSKLKWEIRDRLDQSNITERVLFPGLDGISSWLKRFYATTQRDQAKSSSDRVDSALQEIDKALLPVKASNHITTETVNRILKMAISVGAPIYKDVSPKDCVDIYLYTINNLLDILNSPHLGYEGEKRDFDLLATYLSRAVAKGAVDSLAWGLRHALDDVLRSQHLHVSNSNR